MDTYYIPKDGPLSMYKEYVSQLPTMDNPEAFGQHSNADVASQITEARMLFETLLSLQPKEAVNSGPSQEDQVKSNYFLSFMRSVYCFVYCVILRLIFVIIYCF